MFETPQPATALHRFAETYYQSIQYAALQLGSTNRLRRAQQLLDDLGQPRKLTRRIIHEAEALATLFAQNQESHHGRSTCVQASVCNHSLAETDEIKQLAEGFRKAIAQTAGSGMQDSAECKEKCYD